MVAMLPDVYRVLAAVTGAAIPATMLVEQGLPTVEKYGIIGLLFIFLALFVKLWRDSDTARNNEHKERIKKLEEIITKKDTELALERAKKNL